MPPCSVFISYRVASDAPLASLIFDDLNHTVTPGGHRVTVYWDSHRLVAGQDWEHGFSTALLNSLCIFPILSYGSTAPMAGGGGVAHGRITRRPSVATVAWWPEEVAGRRRLKGEESDPKDNVLKEFLIAGALLRRRAAEDRELGEQGRLQLAYPILVGPQHPPQHPDYPGMGDFFSVQGGGGRYPGVPSPATNKAAVSFLRSRARLPERALDEVANTSVAAGVGGLTAFQGCRLWHHSSSLQGADLTKEQGDLVGTGIASPPTSHSEDGNDTVAYDLQQLRMLKAQACSTYTHAPRPAHTSPLFFRALARHLRRLGLRPGRCGPSGRPSTTSSTGQCTWPPERRTPARAPSRIGPTRRPRRKPRSASAGRVGRGWPGRSPSGTGSVGRPQSGEPLRRRSSTRTEGSDG